MAYLSRLINMFILQLQKNSSISKYPFIISINNPNVLGETITLLLASNKHHNGLVWTQWGSLTNT